MQELVEALVQVLAQALVAQVLEQALVVQVLEAAKGR